MSIEDNVNPSDTTITDPIVQYIAIRSDLKWPKGALIAQCCHASTAVIHLNYNDEETKKYLNDLDSMHKIVVGVPTVNELNELHTSLNDNKISCKLWIEQPENIPTCLAIKPCSKKSVETFFKMFKLFR
jgi:peptidyl-tRNA hydrolase